MRWLQTCTVWVSFSPCKKVRNMEKVFRVVFLAQTVENKNTAKVFKDCEAKKIWNRSKCNNRKNWKQKNTFQSMWCELKLCWVEEVSFPCFLLNTQTSFCSMIFHRKYCLILQLSMLYCGEILWTYLNRVVFAEVFENLKEKLPKLPPSNYSMFWVTSNHRKFHKINDDNYDVNSVNCWDVNKILPKISKSIKCKKK